MKKMVGLISTNYVDPSLGALTKDRPIATLPFGGRYRLVDFPLSNMENSGITTVGMITPYMYRSLMDHVGVGKEWSLNRKVGGMFILPGSIYGYRNIRGKFLMRDLIQNISYVKRAAGDVVVCSGSNKIFNMDYRKAVAYHEKTIADVTLIYKKQDCPENTLDYRIEINDQGRAIKLTDEGENCFLDTFIINADLVLNIAEWYADLGYMDFIDIISENLDKMDVRTYEFDGYCASVDGLSSYMNANWALLDEDVRKNLFPPDRPIHTKVQDSPPAKYMCNSSVRDAIVSTGCIIDGKVESSILFRGVNIKKDADVRCSVLMQGCVIGEGASLENVICDKYAKVSPGVKLVGNPENPIIVGKREEI